MKWLFDLFIRRVRDLSLKSKHRLINTGRVIGVLMIFYFSCVHYLEPHQGAIVWNWASGELYVDTKAAWHITGPWVVASRIDLRPQRVCITSTTRGVNCKLVRFEPNAYREFVATEGFRYYWLSNCISFNWGYDEEYRGWRDVLRGYAFSTKKYPFLTIIQEYQQ